MGKTFLGVCLLALLSVEAEVTHEPVHELRGSYSLESAYQDLAIFSKGTSADECTNYTIGKVQSNGTICGQLDKNLFTVNNSVCTGSTSCMNNHTYIDGYIDILTHRDIYCVESIPPIKYSQDAYPGSKCEKDSDCIAYKVGHDKGCEKGICQGYKEGEVFKNHTGIPTGACDPGLFAKNQGSNTLECLKQYQEGNVCSYPYQCQNGLTCANGKCIKVGSLKNGSKFKFNKQSGPDSLDSGAGICCESFYADPSVSSSLMWECKDPPKSVNPAAECKTNDDCKTTDEFSEVCQCGLSGKKHCSLSEGDAYKVKYRQLLKEWLLSSQAKSCNAYATASCVNDYASKNFTNYFNYYHILASNYQFLKGADETVVKTLAPRYYSLNKTVNSKGQEILKNGKLQWHISEIEAEFQLTIDSSVVKDYDWYGVALKEPSSSVSMANAEYVVVKNLSNPTLQAMNTVNYTANGRPQNQTEDPYTEISYFIDSNINLVVKWTLPFSAFSNSTLSLKEGNNYTLLFAYGKMSGGVIQKHEETDRGYGNITLSNDFVGNVIIPSNDTDSSSNLCTLLILSVLQLLF
mmetsp:Transcript_11850/g.17334  ORF Transcript_11850/g.17334 Transcript_11850/m.17334 type:complete len:576 (-) Transcript_11850:28-1755(-)